VCPFFLGAAGSPSNTTGPRPTSGILVHQAVWPQRTMAKNWGGGLCPFTEGELGPHLTQCRSRTKRHLEPCSRLATIDVGRKLGAPPLSGERGLYTKSPGLRPTSIPSGILMHPPFGHNKNGPKLRGSGSAPFWGRGAGSPSSTMWRGPRPTSMPSAILIHPAVWSQWTWAENGEGAPLPFWGGELGPHLTQSRLG